MVGEFTDVFSDELPTTPLSHRIDFVIDLMPGTGPISKAPYRKAPKEMEELKTQLEEMLEKGYISPSVSP